MNEKSFQCIPGMEYRLPLNPNLKPIISLRIEEDCGHNSIKTRCLNCGDVSTYSKNQLQDRKVYLCKACGKRSVYTKRFANLIVEKIKEEGNNVYAVCTCKDCGATADYEVDKLYRGIIANCRHCIAGIKKGKKIQNFIVNKIIVTKTDTKIIYKVHLECSKCNKVVLETDPENIIKALKENISLDKYAKCDCFNKMKDPSRVNKETEAPKPVKQAIKVKVPSETDLFTNIELKEGTTDKVVATCRNCEIRKTYNLSYILDDGVCSICRDLRENDAVAYKPITDSDIRRARLTAEGEAHVVKMKKRYALTVTDTKLINNDYIASLKSKSDYIPSIFCKCNNCGIETKYSATRLDSDIKNCKVCNFEILLYSKVGFKGSEDYRYIKSFEFVNNKVSINTQCNSCGTIVRMSKDDVLNNTLGACPVCAFRKGAGKNLDSEVVGHLFGTAEPENINNYTKIGKYIVVKYTRNTLKSDKTNITYNIKAICSDCGRVVTGPFKNINDFDEQYGNGNCERCSTLESSVKNYINNNNWIGYIKNCRVIQSVFTENSIKKAETKCLLCGDIKVIPLTVFLNSNTAVCDNCRDNVVLMRCPSCNNLHDIKITLSELYSDNDNLDKDILFSRKLLCPVTKKTNKLSQLKLYQEEQSRLDFLRSNYSELGDLYEVPGNPDLVMSTEKYYTGTDGEKYNTCYCKKHNKFLTLKEDEAIVYDHLYCADTRMRGYM